MTDQMTLFLYGDISSIPTMVLRKKLNGYRTAINLICKIDQVCEVICRMEGELMSRRELVINIEYVAIFNDREILGHPYI